MQKLQDVREEAINETKQKIDVDIMRYMQERKSCPTFDDYVTNRRSFFHQVWINTWLNRVTNDLMLSHKKAFLRSRGIELNGMEKKWVNQLFRNEIREIDPFDGEAWLKETVKAGQEWRDRFDAVKDQQKEDHARIKRSTLQKEIRRDILQWVEDQVRKKELAWYAELRYLMAQKVAGDIGNKKKFILEEDQLREEGAFHSSHYPLLEDFMGEFTGSLNKKSEHWDRDAWEYETYLAPYERFSFYHADQLIMNSMLEALSEDHLERYLEAFGQPLNMERLSRMNHPLFLSIMNTWFNWLGEEKVERLLEIAEGPWDPEVQLISLTADMEDREEREREEREEQERKQREEEAMMESIFGREYSAPGKSNIRYILHLGETNTGKTHTALESMKKARSGMYLAPLRLLALEVYDKLNREGIPCNLKTGEEEKVTVGALHSASTVEMFHEKDHYDVVVIDEAQMISDQDRGYAWYRAITKSRAKEVHIIGSTNVEELLFRLLSEEDVTVHHYKREIPLQVEAKEFKLRSAKKGDAIVCFSRKKVLETASRLQSGGHKVSMIYGSMPPETRKKQMMQFIEGKTNLIVSTDAIGMGLNLPIRRIVFLETEKFDGTRRRRLSSQEVKQIAGRAGRKGLYEVGKVSFSRHVKAMEKLLHQEDRPLNRFAVAPTSSVFERFQRYSNHLGTFFELWDRFQSPEGTEKASLIEEKELYERIEGSDIEARLSLDDLYGFLHLPFSKKEDRLITQWLQCMHAIIDGEELPEPVIRTRNLEQQELSYKSVGLHLLFLYRLGRQTEAAYWERVREEIADGVHDSLSDEVQSYSRTCRSCGKKLPPEFGFSICDRCHGNRSKRKRRRLS